MKIIYENKKPKFAIGRDSYQWILCKKETLNKGKVEWRQKTYHPNLSNLLGELAEVYFKKNTKKLEEIRDLDNSISKVYNLISEVSQTLSRVL